MAVNIRTDPPFDYLQIGEQFQGIHGDAEISYVVSNVLRMPVTEPYSHAYLSARIDALYTLLEPADRSSTVTDFLNKVSIFTKANAGIALPPLSIYLIADTLFRMSGPEEVVRYNGDWSLPFADFGILNAAPIYNEGRGKGRFISLQETSGFVISTYGLSTANGEHPVIRRTAFGGMYMHIQGLSVVPKLCIQLAEIAVGNFVSNSELRETSTRQVLRGGRSDGNRK